MTGDHPTSRRTIPGTGASGEGLAEKVLAEVRACRICADFLPQGPRPIVQLSPEARILVISQAPGRLVHQSGRPFSDPSGVRLRSWMGISDEDFYDPRQVAIVPMGFCYPGTGGSGDCPPRPECAPQWHESVLKLLPSVELKLIVGQYALKYYLPDRSSSVTQAVRAWEDLWPGQVPMPHPSWHNNRWLMENRWFEAELIPRLQRRISAILRR
jgi:uracil-DNA glycosylase